MQKYTFVFHVIVFVYLYKCTSRCMQFSDHYIFVLPLLRKSEYIDSDKSDYLFCKYWSKERAWLRLVFSSLDRIQCIEASAWISYFQHWTMMYCKVERLPEISYYWFFLIWIRYINAWRQMTCMVISSLPPFFCGGIHALR